MSQRQPRTTLCSCLSLLLLSATAHAAPGDLDSSFGVNGRVFFQPPELGDTSVSPFSLLVQADGKVVTIAGTATPLTKIHRDNLIVRFNADGTLDTSFNRVGYKLMSINIGSNTAASIVQLADGKLRSPGRRN